MKCICTILVVLLLFSCEGGSYKRDTVQFGEPLNTRWLDFSQVIGDSTLIYNDEDTTVIQVFYSENNKQNVVVGDGDTIFEGRVNKYKGLYLFNRYLNNEKVIIHAVKVEDDLITGLDSEFWQSILLEKYTLEEPFNRNIADTTGGITTIEPIKRDLKNIFNIILDSLPSYQYAPLQKEDTEGSMSEQESVTEAKPLEVYPNPFTNKIIVNNHESSSVHFVLINDNMETVLSGILSNGGNVLNVGGLSKGVYFLKTNKKGFRLVKE